MYTSKLGVSIKKNPGFLDKKVLEEKKSFSQRVKKDFIEYKEIYFMLIPIIVYYLIFAYKPMYGVIIAFKEFSPGKGIVGSPWVGLAHFKEFFNSMYFSRVLGNTLWISTVSIVFGFPAPIILALLINELKSKKFTKTVQTITYLPHFISTVVICGMLKDFLSDRGFITQLLSLFGLPTQNLLENPDYFVPIYVISDIWQGVGWGSIIYLAALTGINMELYEAAKIDGANRWKQTIYVTIPGIIPTVIVMLILRMGNLLSIGFEKIILLYNPATYVTADVISSFVYRRGLIDQSWSYSAAVGLFNSIINFVLLISSNMLSRKFNNTSIW